MKKLLPIAILVLSSSAFAANCLSTSAPASRCEVQVVGNTISECYLTGTARPAYTPNYPGNFPGRYNPGGYVYPWRRVAIGEEVSRCDVSLEECKDFAFRRLQKFEYVSNCGDISRGMRVNFAYQSLNNDSTVAEEITGSMRK